MKEWAVVDVLVYSFHAVEDSLGDLSIVFALELDCGLGTG